jgi:hypothetical protein
MFENIKTKIRNMFIFNTEYHPVGISGDLSVEENLKLKANFYLFQNFTLMIAIIYLICSLYFVYMLINIDYGILISLFLSSVSGLYYYKNNIHKSYNLSGNIIVCSLITFLPLSLIGMFFIFIILLNISKKITILSKKVGSITTVISLNLQEYDYKNGKLQSFGIRPAIRKILKDTNHISIYDDYTDSYFYHKGYKWNIEYKNENKYAGMDEGKFIEFKRTIDLKSKIGNF